MNRVSALGAICCAVSVNGSAGQEQGGSRIFSRLSLWMVSAWHHLHEVVLVVRHCSRRNALMMFFSLSNPFRFSFVPPCCGYGGHGYSSLRSAEEASQFCKDDQRIIRARPVLLAGTSRRSLSQQRWHPRCSSRWTRPGIPGVSDARRATQPLLLPSDFRSRHRSTVCDQIAEA